MEKGPEKVTGRENVLYHYTDYIAFNGIMRDRELRVNNVRNMNDAEEMNLFISGIFRAVEKQLKHETTGKSWSGLINSKKN